MNSMMPDAPPGAQALMQAPQGAPQPQAGAGAMMAPPNAMMGPQQAPGAPQAPPGPPPTKAQIDEARKHSNAIVSGLMSLTSKPKGELTKDDVFKEASDMISKGAFPTPSSRQALIVELANLPDDEAGLRKALGAHLLAASAARQQFHGVFGTGAPAATQNPASPAMPGAV
jgi:hypothetical protein